jgi:hypothetical protein
MVLFNIITDRRKSQPSPAAQQEASMQDIRLIEPVPIEDELCTGLAIIEEVDGVGGRLVFYAKQTCYESGEPVLAVKRKIVLTTAAIGQAAEALAAFTGRQTPRGKLLQLNRALAAAPPAGQA